MNTLERIQNEKFRVRSERNFQQVFSYYMVVGLIVGGKLILKRQPMTFLEETA